MTDEETIDDFLGGCVRLIQPRAGYRVSMDTVMLAASIPARAGETVLEGGVGSAGASLCLARRVDGLQVKGIDIQSDMVALARKNIDLNGLSDRVSVQETSIKDLSGAQSQYDHIMINPPYLPAGKAICPPDDNKGQAHMDLNANLRDWIRFCVHYVKQKGTVTLVYRADRMDEVISYLYGRVGDLMIMPLWPRLGSKAKRVIIQGRKGMSGAVSMLPGLALHGDVARYTPEADEILRQGKALDLKAFARGEQSG
jgi:tRNA1(Val) A37 N6-methylase TrmN6